MLEKQLISIANFNLHNLVSPNVLYYENLSYTQEEYDIKLNWCAQQLQRMNADIVAFQEVFHSEALQELCTRSILYKSAQILSPHTEEDEPRIALVSRLPIVDFDSYSVLPEELSTPYCTHFRRPPLRATVRLENNKELQIFVLHLKSKLPEYVDNESNTDLLAQAKATARSLNIRATEAVAIRTLVLAHNHLPTILVGDLNDSSHSVTTSILKGPKPRRDFPKDTQQVFWSNRFIAANDMMHRRTRQDVSFTYIYDGYYQNIDQILLSNHFHPASVHPFGKLVYLQHFNDHLIDRSLGFPNKTPGASDHGQIVAHLEIFTKELAKRSS